MCNFKVFVCFCTVLLFSGPALWSQDYKVLLKSGDSYLPENFETFLQNPRVSADEIVDGWYYRWIQFREIPNQQQLTRLENQGIQLINYIPHYTYLAAIPEQLNPTALRDYKIRSVVQVPLEIKRDEGLMDEQFPDWALKGDKVQVVLQYHRNLSQEKVIEWCRKEQMDVEHFNGINNFIAGHIPISRISDFVALPFVTYINLATEPGEPEDVIGRGMHRSNAIDTEMMNGRSYTGEGVNILVRDDGFVGPHIDFHGRLEHLIFVDDGFDIDHGDGVAGIFAGAGNVDPGGRGMAAGAFVYVSEYEANFLDNATLPQHTARDILVTNSSYSNGCNVGYTNTTQTVDQQMYENPTYLHVFSAGNSNNLDCGYGAGDQWGNITGGHKQGKNVIATANLTNIGELQTSSSRGPAHGRKDKTGYLCSWCRTDLY